MTHEDRVRAARVRFGAVRDGGYVYCQRCPLYAACTDTCKESLLHTDDACGCCNGRETAWEAIARWQEQQEAEASNAQPSDAQPSDAVRPSQGAKADAELRAKLKAYEDSGLTPEMCESIGRALAKGRGTAVIAANRAAAVAIAACILERPHMPIEVIVTLGQEEKDDEKTDV